MDFVNIIYRYVNRFINSEELICLLENIDHSKFSDDELKEINSLLEEVKEIIKSTSNEIDIVEERRLENINHILELIENHLDIEGLDEKRKSFVKRTFNDLLKDKEKVRDSGPIMKNYMNI